MRRLRTQLVGDLCPRGIGARAPHRLSPLPRRIAEPIGRVQRQSLGDVLGVAIHHPPQVTRPGEHSSDTAPSGPARSPTPLAANPVVVARPGSDRAGLVSRRHRETSRAPAGRVPARSSPIVGRSHRAAWHRPTRTVRRSARRLLSTSEGGDRCGDHGEEADPGQHHDRGDEPAGSLLWRDVAVPHGGDRLQREPQTLADRRILLMVEKPLQDPARHRDHHREHGDDPGGPARSQRVMEQQARRQRNLSRTIRRRVLDNVSLAILGLAHISRPGFERSHNPYTRPPQAFSRAGMGLRHPRVRVRA